LLPGAVACGGQEADGTRWLAGAQDTDSLPDFLTLSCAVIRRMPWAASRPPPTSVVGTNQIACSRIANASARERSMPRRSSEATPSHWYVPTNPGEEGIATPRLITAVTNRASTTRR